MFLKKHWGGTAMNDRTTVTINQAAQTQPAEAGYDPSRLRRLDSHYMELIAAGKFRGPAICWLVMDESLPRAPWDE
jgi:hypothetical protein